MRLLAVLPFAIAATSANGREVAPADPEEQVQRSNGGAGTAAEFVTGLEYQEGDYFTGERVEILSFQNVARLRIGRTVFSASLPWRRIEAPGNFVGGGGLLGLPVIVDPNLPVARSVRRGVGDLRLGIAHSLPRLAGFEIALSGQVKLPTASVRRGIGTGEVDLGVGAEFSRRLGPVTPFVSVDYTIPGDPETYALRDGLSARGGVALQFARTMRARVSYGYAQSLSPLVPDEEQLSTGLDAALSPRISLGLYGNAGLSNGAPDLGAGLSLGFRIF